MHVLEEISTDQYFNSQPLKEADNSYTIEFCCLFYFNSQPLKEADPVVRLSVPALRHFNSQPHKEADSERKAGLYDRAISPHSLSRRLPAGNMSLIRQSIFHLTASQGG